MIIPSTMDQWTQSTAGSTPDASIRVETCRPHRAVTPLFDLQRTVERQLEYTGERREVAGCRPARSAVAGLTHSCRPVVLRFDGKFRGATVIGKRKLRPEPVGLSAGSWLAEKSYALPLCQAVADCECCRFGTIGGMGLRQNGPNVVGNRVRTQEEPVRDFTISEPARDQ